MKILWVCNKKPAIISRIQNQLVDCFGGWLDSMCENIVANSKNSIYICYPSNAFEQGENENIRFTGFENKNCESCFQKVVDTFVPDVIHIWGTEFSHTAKFIKICREKNLLDNTVISIQGLTSIYAEHYYEGLPFKTVYGFTLRDLIKRDNIKIGKKKFVKRGIFEKEALKITKNVIGRTDFDKSVIDYYNQNAKYYFCNESLRNSFYENAWDIKKIERHSIFVSQCSYPIKGLHFLLEAMPVILKKFPDAKIYTTGPDLNNLSFKEKLLQTSYQRYLRKLIKKYDLSKHICFLGRLSEKEMCDRYLKSNVFVSPSTIENSPNSLGEAMLLGCPAVASDVGGVKNMMLHEIEGFVYPTTASYMLGFYVNKIFEDDGLAVSISENAKKHAQTTHNREINFNKLMDIYGDMIK